VEPEALLLLGEIYLKLDEVEAARQALNELVARFPDTGEAKRAQGILGKLAQG
jgi:TolA-binding protein